MTNRGYTLQDINADTSIVFSCSCTLIHVTFLLLNFLRV